MIKPALLLLLAPLSVHAATDTCKSLAAVARTSALEVEAKRRVAGAGRLQFYSAPSQACAIKGLFVVAGDMLDAHLTLEDFVFVTYTNPKTGKKVDGWIDGRRLHE